MQGMINARQLIYGTGLSVAFGALALWDSELNVLVIAAGFFYGIVLFYSIRPLPKSWQIVVGVAILSVANYFSILSSAPVFYIGEVLGLELELYPDLSWFLFLLLAGYGGAIVTVLVLRYLWGIKLSSRDLGVLLVLLGVATLLSVFVSSSFVDLFRNEELPKPFLLNSLFWWLFFSIGLLVAQKRVLASQNELSETR